MPTPDTIPPPAAPPSWDPVTTTRVVAALLAHQESIDVDNAVTTDPAIIAWIARAPVIPTQSGIMDTAPTALSHLPEEVWIAWWSHPAWQASPPQHRRQVVDAWCRKILSGATFQEHESHWRATILERLDRVWPDPEESHRLASALLNAALATSYPSNGARWWTDDSMAIWQRHGCDVIDRLNRRLLTQYVALHPPHVRDWWDALRAITPPGEWEARVTDWSRWRDNNAEGQVKWGRHAAAWLKDHGMPVPDAWSSPHRNGCPTATAMGAWLDRRLGENDGADAVRKECLRWTGALDIFWQPLHAALLMDPGYQRQLDERQRAVQNQRLATGQTLAQWLLPRLVANQGVKDMHGLAWNPLLLCPDATLLVDLWSGTPATAAARGDNAPNRSAVRALFDRVPEDDAMGTPPAEKPLLRAAWEQWVDHGVMGRWSPQQAWEQYPMGVLATGLLAARSPDSVPEAARGWIAETLHRVWLEPEGNQDPLSRTGNTKTSARLRVDDLWWPLTDPGNADPVAWSEPPDAPSAARAWRAAAVARKRLRHRRTDRRGPAPSR